MKNTPWLRRKTSGQALVVIIAAFFGMIMLMGLMLDLGQIFLAKAYLRRTADAAALAAAAQFREDREDADLVAVAKEISKMNNITPTEVDVETCINTPGDTELCELSGGVTRKLVRVRISMILPLTFMNLVGIKDVTLTEASVSEAASMDLVLVLDLSESMTWEADIGDANRDPSVCNAAKTCEPFESVREAAKKLVEKFLGETFPGSGVDNPAEQDRLAIVTFANGWQNGDIKGTQKALFGTSNWTRKRSEAIAFLDSMTVYDPGVVCGGGGSNPDEPSTCRYYDGFGNFRQLACTYGDLTQNPEGYSACGTTNIGGGLFLAGQQFATEKRLEALWVSVLLTDGAANSSFTTYDKLGITPGDNTLYTGAISNLDVMDNMPFAFCPVYDGSSYAEMEDINLPHRIWCQDGDADDFHSPMSALDYDASDFAWDQAKFVSCAARDPAAACGGTKGQGAVLFTIGLGDHILALDAAVDPADRVPYGGYLLRKMAAVGDDGDPATDPCVTMGFGDDYTQSCGNYYFAPSGNELNKVFEAIASRIFTRLTK
jgi:hypothetical protein